jgi:hypothetical protein
VAAPSPADLRPYLGDLVLVDLTPQDVADLAIAELAQRVPGWEPLEASPEVALISALAVEVSQLANAANRIPVAVLQALLGVIGVPRDLGAPPTGLAALYSNDPGNAVTIPAGTRLRLELGDGLEPVDFALDEDTEIPEGGEPVIAAMTGTTNTADANGPHYLDPLVILDAVALTSAAVIGAPAGGRPPENGPEYLERASRILGRLTETLVMPAHFTARALELVDAGVVRATTLNLYDADTDTLATGHVTVAVIGDEALELDPLVLEDIRADLAARALASLVVHVVNATVTTVDVKALVTVAAGYSASLVEAAAVEALTTYLDPMGWPWRGTVYRNALLGVVAGVEGVEAVVDVVDPADDTPLEDIALGGAASLAKPGTIEAATEEP